MADVDELLGAWGRAQREGAPPVAVPTLPTRDSRPTRRAAWLPGVAAAVVVLAVAIGAVVFRGGAAPSPVRDDSGYRPGTHIVLSGQARGAIVHNGDVVTGSGEIVAPPGEPVRFCAPGSETVGTDVRPDPDAICPLWVQVRGLDLKSLPQRQVSGGVVIGMATLTGTYRDKTIDVTSVGAAAGIDTFDALPTRVPCATPSGGWPTTPESRDLSTAAAQRYRQAHAEEVPLVGALRLSSRVDVMYVLTTGDVAAATAALSPAYGESLCVVEDRFSLGQARRAGDALSPLVGAGLFAPASVNGIDATFIGPDGQTALTAAPPILDQRFADLVDAQPAGLVRLDVWLVPAG